MALVDVDVNALVPSDTVAQLGAEFQARTLAKGEGLSLVEFCGMMLKYLPHSQATQEALVVDLCELFRQIDFNGDNTVEWHEFTSFCVECGMVASRVAAASVDFNLDESPYHDTTTTGASIKSMKYIQDLDQVFVCETGVQNVKFYQSNLRYIKQLEVSLPLPKHMAKRSQTHPHDNIRFATDHASRMAIARDQAAAQSRAQVYGMAQARAARRKPKKQATTAAAGLTSERDRNLIAAAQAERGKGPKPVEPYSDVVFVPPALVKARRPVPDSSGILSISLAATRQAKDFLSGAAARRASAGPELRRKEVTDPAPTGVDVTVALCVEYIKEFNYLVVSSSDNSMTIWKADTLTFVGLMSPAIGPTVMKWCPDLQRLLVNAGSSGGDIFAWDVQTQRSGFRLRDHTDSVTALLVVESHQLIISGSMDHRVLLWTYVESTGPRVHGELGPFRQGVRDLQYLPASDLLVVVSFDTDAQLWDISSKLLMYRVTGHRSTLLCASPCYSSPYHLLTVDVDGVFKVWYVVRNAMTHTPPQIATLDSTVGLSKFSPSVAAATGPSMLVATGGRRLRLLKMTRIASTLAKVCCVAYCQDMLWFVVCNENGYNLHSAVDGRILSKFQDVFIGVPTAVCAGNRHRIVVIGTSAGRVLVVNVRTGMVLKDCTPHTSEVTGVIYCHEDKCIISVSWDRSLCVHDELPPDEAPLLRCVHGAHDADILCVAFSYSLSLIVTGGADGTLRLWDFQTLKLVGICEGHEAAVTAVVFLDPLPLMASADAHGYVLLWATRPSLWNARCLMGLRCRPHTFKGHAGPESPAAAVAAMTGFCKATPSGGYVCWLYVADENGYIKMWDLSHHLVYLPLQATNRRPTDLNSYNPRMRYRRRFAGSNADSQQRTAASGSADGASPPKPFQDKELEHAIVNFLPTKKPTPSKIDSNAKSDEAPAVASPNSNLPRTSPRQVGRFFRSGSSMRARRPSVAAAAPVQEAMTEVIDTLASGVVESPVVPVDELPAVAEQSVESVNMLLQLVQRVKPQVKAVPVASVGAILRGVGGFIRAKRRAQYKLAVKRHVSARQWVLSRVYDDVMPRLQWKGHNDLVKTLTMASDPPCLLSVDSDSTARLWSMQGDLLGGFGGIDAADWKWELAVDVKTWKARRMQEAIDVLNQADQGGARSHRTSLSIQAPAIDFGGSGHQRHSPRSKRDTADPFSDAEMAMHHVLVSVTVGRFGDADGPQRIVPAGDWDPRKFLINRPLQETLARPVEILAPVSNPQSRRSSLQHPPAPLPRDAALTQLMGTLTATGQHQAPLLLVGEVHDANDDLHQPESPSREKRSPHTTPDGKRPDVDTKKTPPGALNATAAPAEHVAPQASFMSLEVQSVAGSSVDVPLNVLAAVRGTSDPTRVAQHGNVLYPHLATEHSRGSAVLNASLLRDVDVTPSTFLDSKLHLVEGRLPPSIKKSLGGSSSQPDMPRVRPSTAKSRTSVSVGRLPGSRPQSAAQSRVRSVIAVETARSVETEDSGPHVDVATLSDQARERLRLRALMTAQRASEVLDDDESHRQHQSVQRISLIKRQKSYATVLAPPPEEEGKSLHATPSVARDMPHLQSFLIKDPDHRRFGDYSLQDVLAFKHMYSQIDKDGSGTINIEEFMASESFQSSDMFYMSKSVFRSLDKDGSGDLEIAELLPVVFPLATPKQLREIATEVLTRIRRELMAAAAARKKWQEDDGMMENIQNLDKQAARLGIDAVSVVSTESVENI